MFPLDNFYLPKLNSQGEFGAIRKFDIHTGIDLYCEENEPVYAIEDGIVIDIFDFTGDNAGSSWWNNTSAITIEGKCGVILYGEIQLAINISKMSKINKGKLLGFVKKVLKKDKGLPMTMLHLEWYKHGYRGQGEIWKLGEEKPEMLLDSTILINNLYTEHNAIR